jgi:hypothetical protein
MDSADVEQSIIFFESLLLECAICPDRKGCGKEERIKRFLKRVKTEEHWLATVAENDEAR